MNRKRFGQSKKSYNVQSMLNSLSATKRSDVDNLMHDFAAHQNDKQRELEEKRKMCEMSIRQHFQSIVMQIPFNIQKYTIDEVLQSNGELTLEASDDCHYGAIKISKALVMSANENNSLLQSTTNTTNRSRQALSNVSSAINSSKRKQLANSINSKPAIAIKLPLNNAMHNNAVVNNSTNTMNRVLRSAAKGDALTGNQSRIKHNSPQKEFALKQVDDKSANGENSGFKAENIIDKRSARMSNAKALQTPLPKVESIPFLKKAPRKPAIGDDIIFYSSSGTPLVVDQTVGQSVKRIIIDSVESSGK